MSAQTAVARPPWSASLEEVEEYVARYGTPFDPQADDYQDPGPFADAIKTGKNSPTYNAHSYHTKVPPEGIVSYLEHYTQPGDLVLDPFCGSGMTGVACIMTGRHAVLNDLSPAATHIAHNYCTPVDADDLARAWARIKGETAEEFARLYDTICDRCREPATIQYTVWSDIFGCGRCGEEIVLWDVAVVRENTGEGLDPPLSPAARITDRWRPTTTESAPPKRGAGGRLVPRTKGDVLDVFPCPGCGSQWKKTQVSFLRSEPVLTEYECPRCRPKRHRRATTRAERDRIAEFEVLDVPYWYPSDPFEETREMWRGAHRDGSITRVSDFWTQRNLRAVARLWQEIGQVRDARVASALAFVFTACLLKTNRLTRFKFWKAGNGPLSGTLYVGSFVVENNVSQVFERKLADIRKYLESMAIHWLDDQKVITTVHAGQDTGIESESIDYIFTDPPFGSNIFYADLNLMWEAWLGHMTDDTHEAVWNKSKRPTAGGKTLEDYARLMAESFAEMHRVLKPGHWASVVFHNSDDRVWDAIRRAVTDAGFHVEGAVAFDKGQKSFKGVRGAMGLERVSDMDIVLNLRKPRIGEVQREAAGERPGRGRDTDRPTDQGNGPHNADAFAVTQTIATAVEHRLRETQASEGRDQASNASSHHPRSTQDIHSAVIQRLISNGDSTTGVSLSKVVDVLSEYFKEVDDRWYLPGEDVGDVAQRDASATSDQRSLMWTVEFAVPKNETSAIEWLRAFIRLHGPQLQGRLVDEFRLKAPGLVLVKPVVKVLEENFTYDGRRGRWRLPTDDESEAMLSVQVRLLEQRVSEVLEGRIMLPPAESLGQLVEACYHDGLYRQGWELWNRLDQETLPEDKLRMLLRIARVCRSRSESGD